MKKDYADMCGYTEDELNKYFTDGFKIAANELEISENKLREKIKE